MAWGLHEIRRKKATYMALKKNYRVGKQVKSDYIYLGSPDIAARILADMQMKHLISEKEVSYSGELILGKIARSIRLKEVLDQYLDDKRASTVMQNLIILRTLFPESKRRLAERLTRKSVLKNTTDLRYVEEIYRFMDRIYAHLGDVLYGAVQNAVRHYDLDLTYMIIDGTGIKIWKDEETGLVRFGHTKKNDRGGLPQVNLVLAVNGQHVPLFANTYPGNMSDTDTFADFLRLTQTRYRQLAGKVKKTFMVFDQGNVSEANIGHLCELEGQYGVHFVTLLRTTSLPKFIKKVDRPSLPLIYTSGGDDTNNVYGEFVEEDVYGRSERVLVCYNPDIAKNKSKALGWKVELITRMAADGGGLEDINALVVKYHLKRAIKAERTGENEKVELKINQDELNKRKARYGFFGVFTRCKNLTAEELIKIYKSRNIVEEGFRALKSDLEIAPVHHSKDERIETHTVLVVSGYLLLSLLRAVLMSKGGVRTDDGPISFPWLRDTIRSGRAVEGLYVHESLKHRLRIWRPTKQQPVLEKIFKVLNLKVPTFDVKEIIPTVLEVP